MGGGRARRGGAQAHRGPRGRRRRAVSRRTRASTSSPTASCGATPSSATSIEALDGFDKFGGWAIPFHDDHGGELVFKRPVVVEKLRWRHSMCAEEWVYLRSRATRADQGHADEHPAGGGLLRSREVGAAPIHARRLSRRRRRLHAPRGRGAGPPRLHLHPDRRAPVRRPPGPALREGYRQRAAIPTV